MNLLSLIGNQLQQQNEWFYLPDDEFDCGSAHQFYYENGLHRKPYTLDRVDNTFYLVTSIYGINITFSFTAEEEKLKATPNLPDAGDDENFFHVAMTLLLPITLSISIPPKELV